MTAQVITECIRGHVYTPENTRTEKDGYRKCRECDRIRARESRGGRPPGSVLPYPEDLALKVQKTYHAWLDAYEEYLETRAKNTRHRRAHLNRINELYAEYQRADERYRQQVVA